MKRITSAILLALATMTNSLHADSFVIEDIDVQGLERVTLGATLAQLPLEIGGAFDESQAASVIRSLFQSGLFDDVSLYRQQNTLIIRVQERPSIADIQIEGNKQITTEQLEEALKGAGIAKGRVFKRSVLERLRQELHQQYLASGKYNVEVEAAAEELSRNRVDISIVIKEGNAAKIRQVSIVGNEYFDTQTLLDSMESGVPGPMALFSSRDNYAKPKLSTDIEQIRSRYLDNGFVNFEMESTQVSISPNKQDIFITLNMHEGEQFTLKDIDLLGDFPVEKAELRDLIELEQGDIFSRTKIKQATDRILDVLGEEGYAFANVNPIPELDQENKTVDLTFTVEPGNRVYVRRINFLGNYKTLDEVFRREMRQMEGALYGRSLVERSRVRLQRLRFVENVNIKTNRVPGKPDQVDLDVSISERMAGSFMIGAGYSQSQGVLFNMNLTQDNFMGQGDRVSLTFNNSKVNTVYDLSYTEPYYTLDGISRTWSVFYRETDAEEAAVSAYATDRRGGRMSFGIPLTENNRLRVGQSIEHVRLKLGEDPATEVTDFIDDYGNEYDLFPLTIGFTHDTRDRTIFASEGNLQRINAEYTLPGSDLEYYKVKFVSKNYFGVTDNTSLVVRTDVASGEGLNETESLPFFEKYYAGGVRTVRGYDVNSLGPKDSSGDPLGGDFRFLAGVDFLFPFPGSEQASSSRLSLFYDVGYVYSDIEAFDEGALRSSYGLGLVWLSPVGPLTFSYANPINNEPDDELQAFQFTIGGNF